MSFIVSFPKPLVLFTDFTFIFEAKALSLCIGLKGWKSDCN